MNNLEKYRGLRFVKCRDSEFLQETERVKSWSMGEPIWEDYSYFIINGKKIESFSYNDYLVSDKYPIEIINLEKLNEILNYLEKNPRSYKEQLIEKVLTQIQIDIDFGDLTAIEELLKKVDDKYLEAYLPEIDLDFKLIN